MHCVEMELLGDLWEGGQREGGELCVLKINCPSTASKKECVKDVKGLLATGAFRCVEKAKQLHKICKVAHT